MDYSKNTNQIKNNITRIRKNNMPTNDSISSLFNFGITTIDAGLVAKLGTNVAKDFMVSTKNINSKSKRD